MIKKMAVALFVLAFALSNLYAWDENKEERIMVKGIRPMGMGGAFTAIADDENAVFYNPAGISQRRGWLLQVISIDGRINKETIDTVTDAMDVLSDSSGDSGSDSGISSDKIKEARDTISNKDIEFSLALPNIFFISSPFSINDGNSLSFGLGQYSYVDVGFSMELTAPNWVFTLADQVSKSTHELDAKDIYTMVPMDLVRQFLKDRDTAGQPIDMDWLKDRIDRIRGGDNSAIDEIYDNLTPIAKDVVDDLTTGDNVDYQEIVDKLNTILDLDDLIKAGVVINTYVTAIVDAPFAYRFKSLDAIKLPGELSVGVNLKYIYRVKARKLVYLSADDVGSISDNFDAIDIGVMSGSGFGLDLGTIYHFTPQWNFGLQIADVYTRIKYNSVMMKYPEDAPDSDFTHTATIYPQLNIGAAWTPEVIYYWKDRYFKTKNRFTFALDLRDLGGAYEEKFSDKFHLGAEYRFSPFALRVGINKKYPAFGLGIEMGGFQIGYAFYGDESQLAKALGHDKTVYYHEVLMSWKFGHHDGRPFGKGLKADEPKESKAKQKADAVVAVEEKGDAVVEEAEVGIKTPIEPIEKEPIEKVADEKAREKEEPVKVEIEGEQSLVLQ